MLRRVRVHGRASRATWAMNWAVPLPREGEGTARQIGFIAPSSNGRTPGRTTEGIQVRILAGQPVGPALLIAAPIPDHKPRDWPPKSMTASLNIAISTKSGQSRIMDWPHEQPFPRQTS